MRRLLRAIQIIALACLVAPLAAERKVIVFGSWDCSKKNAGAVSQFGLPGYPPGQTVAASACAAGTADVRCVYCTGGQDGSEDIVDDSSGPEAKGIRNETLPRTCGTLHIGTCKLVNGSWICEPDANTFSCSQLNISQPQAVDP